MTVSAPNKTIWLFFIGLGITLLTLVLVLCFYQVPSKNIMAQQLVNIRDLEIKAEVATLAAQHYKGLSGRASLEEGTGMLFVFPTSERRAFVMRDMEFPLDIIFIHDGKIVNIYENLSPADPNKLYFSEGPVEQVLEINAGLSAIYGLQPGDEVKLQKYEN